MFGMEILVLSHTIENAHVLKANENFSTLNKKIIEQNDFDISFVFDSYSFGGELLMRELKPNLKDDDNNIKKIMMEDFKKIEVIGKINFKLIRETFI